MTASLGPEAGEWFSHQSPLRQSVPGAVERSAKGGRQNVQGCTGYLAYGNLSEVQVVISTAGSYGLGHWGYRLGAPTDTPERASGPCSGTWPAPLSGRQETQ